MDGMASDLAKAFAIDPSLEAESLAVSANFREAGQYKTAANNLAFLEMARPKSLTVKVERLVTEAQAGNVPEACKRLETLQGELEPLLKAKRGWARFKLGDLPAAEKDLEETQKEVPEAAAWLAEVKLELKKIAEAETLFRRQTEREPRNWEMWFMLAETKALADKKVEALEFLDRAVNLHPYCGRVLLRRGELRFQLGQRDKAVRDWTRALELEPELRDKLSPDARTLLAQ
jgi:tetratricopeptide (TPR) repeat protein